MMDKTAFISAVQELGLSDDEYIVIGSGVLCLLGIKDANDIDLVVSVDVFKRYEATGEWLRKDFDDGSYYLTNGVYEIGVDWHSPDLTPNLAKLKSTETIVDEIPAVSLQTLREWKIWKNTDKHLADVQLIDNYLSRS